MKSFHASLTPERWARHEFADQVIMVANELYRARLSLKAGRVAEAREAYLRALDLLDLTSEAARGRRSRLRELRRFREVLAGEWAKSEPTLDENRKLLRVLLLFTPRSALQIAHVWGLFNMHDNVMEWCSDWAAPYPHGPVVDPEGPRAGTHKILRGGAVHQDFGQARSANRWAEKPGTKPPPNAMSYTGFRVVLETGCRPQKYPRGP